MKNIIQKVKNFHRALQAEVEADPGDAVLVLVALYVSTVIALLMITL